MDRRVVVGLAGILLAGVVEVCPAQAVPARDPGAQPPVGMGSIPSIGDSINQTKVAPGAVPMAPSTVPSSPTGVGPDATLPRSPVSPDPVSMVPIDPIHRSINRGMGTFGSMFRRPAERPIVPIFRKPPRVEPAPKVDPSTVPSVLPGPPKSRTLGGRPAPFAGRSPQAPRPQANPPAGSTPGHMPGRPAPFADERPRSARTRASTANPPAYRPVEAPSPAPVTVVVEPMPVAPAEGPVVSEPPPAASEPEAAIPASVFPEPPVELPSPPKLEAATAPVPIGTDPLRGLEPIPAQPPPVVGTPAPSEPSPEPTPAPTPVPEFPPAPSPVDPAVSRTSRDEVAVRTEPVKSRRLPFATIRAAAVGDEIITFNELDTAVKDQLREMMGGQQSSMSEAEFRQLQNQVAGSILNRMIDQALVIQEAKKKMKANSKGKQMFDDVVEKEWKEKELPPLLRSTASTNVHELKIKLASEGKSYESMKESYRKKMMFNEFLRAEIHNQVTADLFEMRLYYDKNRDKFEQPARMTWREVEISVARHPTRAAARQKAEEVLARLLRDEDFAAVARSISNGPTASKGGLYVDMQPGSYGIPVVNDELNRIPTGQVSKILEAPGAFHIIRVDSRRDKGPLRFAEVQDKVRGMVLEQNFQKAVEDYLARLRANTLIRTMFDSTASDPELARRNSNTR